MAVNRPKIFATPAAMAGFCHCSRQTICKFQRDARCPHPRKPWSYEQAVEFRDAMAALRKDRNASQNGQHDSKDDAESAAARELGRAKLQAEISAIQSRDKMLQRKLLEHEGRFILREQAEIECAQKLGAIAKGLSNVARATRHRLADESDPARCEEIVNEAHRELLNGICKSIPDERKP